MAKIIIDKDKCKGCLLCITVCPKGALKADSALNAKGIAPVCWQDDKGCTGCTLCAIVCPDCCIEVRT